ncbi:MAG: apolipoprotein N-acyltransferase [Acidobacteria bacterium]|nr:apolipoprotein N-acyltransferase [Acidobacteriota bacterium]
MAWGVCWSSGLLAPAIPIWMFLLFLAAAPLTTVRQAARLGAVSGLAQYAVGAHFQLALVAYSSLAVAIYLMTLLYIVPFAAGCLALAFWLERRTGVRRELGIALLFPLLEVFRAVSPLSLPADLTAHAFGRLPAWLAWSPWIGPYGVTLWSTLVAYLAWRAICVRRRAPLRAAFATGALLLWLAPPLTHVARGRGDTAQAAPFKVAIVQPSLSLEQKLDRSYAPDIWRRLEELTLAGSSGVDLVLWPETIRPGPVLWNDNEPFHDAEVEAIARKAGVPILYGCVIGRVDPAVRRVSALYNGAALARPDGSPGAWYGKQQLVPFLERVPFARWIGYDPAQRAASNRSWLTLLGNFSQGPEATIFSVGPARIGALICYEGLYPALARQYRRDGANLLAVMVNDSWWGRTFFPAWHARMSAARAIETGNPVVRAGNNGVSCAIGRDGRLIGETRLSEVTTLVASVDVGPVPDTLYVRYGNWILLLDALVLATLGVRGFLLMHGRRSLPGLAAPAGDPGA